MHLGPTTWLTMTADAKVPFNHLGPARVRSEIQALSYFPPQNLYHVAYEFLKHNSALLHFQYQNASLLSSEAGSKGFYFDLQRGNQLKLF